MGERKPYAEALLPVTVSVELIELLRCCGSPIVGVPVTPWRDDCWATSVSKEAASFMDVKVGGAGRIEELVELFASLVRGCVGVNTGWIEVPVGERRSDIISEVEGSLIALGVAVRRVAYGGGRFR